MGFYTNVKPEFLPDYAKHLTGWQTKSVVEPELGNLLVGERLIYEHYGIFGDYIETVDLNFHGDLPFYTIKNDQIISLTARYTEGNFTRYL